VIVAVPGFTPSSEPLVVFMVATAMLLLDQVPPVSELVSVILEFTQTSDGPPMAGGIGLTLIT
jgi:hypothetical protein